MMALLLSWILSAQAADWRLLGLFDAGAIGQLGAPEEEAGWLWRAAPGMERSCGRAKAPDGLGVTEAQAMMGGRMPALAVVVENVGAAEVLDTRKVRMALGHGGAEVSLRPAVVPRALRVHLEGSGEGSWTQLVQTQLEMELCWEHKTGRRWGGGNTRGVREAFLLRTPSVGRAADRMFFRGQGGAVSALTGPSDACFVAGPNGALVSASSGSASPAVQLVPADVWATSLRTCSAEEADGRKATLAGPRMPFTDQDGRQHSIEAQGWQDLVVRVSGGVHERDVRVDMSLDGEPIVTDAPLFEPIDGSEAGGSANAMGMIDLVARLPSRFPTIVQDDARPSYAVLLVPNWQVAEALRQMRGDVDTVRLEDAVGWVLEHPELLFLQIGETTGTELPNLTAPFAARTAPLFHWGYTLGMVSGRRGLVLPQDRVPSWDQVDAAQRGSLHGVFLACAAIVAFAVLRGLFRLRDLWVVAPEERADYWPRTMVATPPPETSTPTSGSLAP